MSADGAGDFTEADFDPNVEHAKADALKEAARKKQLDDATIQEAIRRSSAPGYNAATQRRPEDARMRNEAVAEQRSNAPAPAPAGAPAPAPAVVQGIALQGQISDYSSDSSSDNDGPLLPGQSGGARLLSVEEGLRAAEARAAAATEGDRPSNAVGNLDDLDDLDDDFANSGRGGGGEGDPGAVYLEVDTDDLAEHAVMVVHGPAPNDDVDLSTEQRERVEDEARLLKDRLNKPEGGQVMSDQEAQRVTREWVARCFRQRLPPYKKAARKLDEQERRRHERQQRNAAINFNECANAVKRALWSAPENEQEDFVGLATRVNHHTRPNGAGDVQAQLEREYRCFMREERCRILRVIDVARARGVECATAERQLAEEEEGRYMQSVLADEVGSATLSECLEPLRLDPQRPHPRLPGEADSQKFAERLKAYLEQLEKTKKKPKTNPPDLKALQNCDPCDVWKVSKWPWLATSKEEENEIRQSPEYAIAMNRLVDLKAELNAGTDSISTWSTAFSSAFDADPLARKVSWAEVNQMDWEAFGCEGGGAIKKWKADAAKRVEEAAKKGKELKGGVRVLDLILACRTSHDKNSSTKTDFLETEMLRCFPENKQQGWEINPILDFLCWYNQHIVMRATLIQSAVSQDKQKEGEARQQTKDQALFFSALCAPLVISRSSEAGKRNGAQEARGDMEEQTRQAMDMYYSIYDLYDRLHRTAKRTFEALQADVESPTPLLLHFDQATHARWRALVYGAA